MSRGGVSSAPWAARLAVVLAASVAVAGVVGVTGFAESGGAADDPAAAGFRLADGSAGCRVADGELACRGGGDAAVLEADGSSRIDGVEVTWDESTPVLLPAESWWNGPFRCRSTGASVTCTADEGSITVSADVVGGVR